MKKIISYLLIITLCISLSSCKKNIPFDAKVTSQYYYDYLDTTSSIVIEYDAKNTTEETVKSKLKDVENVLLDIEKTFSAHQTTWMKINNVAKSMVMEVNENSGNAPVQVNDDFIKVLKEAIKIAEVTNGGFDPTIGPLSDLWDISSKAEYCRSDSIDYDYTLCSIPTIEAVNEALELVDYQLIQIDETNKTVFLPRMGMKLDFGSIAKGFAADKIMEFLLNDNYSYISVNLGGNVITHGQAYLYDVNDKGAASIVPIGIRNPYLSRFNSVSLMNINKTNVTIVASGVSERYIEVGGIKYHHILNSQTGYPVDNNIETVSIIGPSSMVSDGLSTGIFSLGLDQGIEYIKQLEGYGAIFITKDYQIYIVGNIDYTLVDGVNDHYTIKIMK